MFSLSRVNSQKSANYFSRLYSRGSFKLGIAQLSVVSDYQKQIQMARESISKLADLGSDIICLGELWSTLFNYDYYKERASLLNEGLAYEMLSKIAKEKQVYVVGGSLPEIIPQAKYGEIRTKSKTTHLPSKSIIANTSPVFDPKGNLINYFRKAHLFDVSFDDQDKITESDYFAKGKKLCYVETPFCKFGVGICFDLRFPEFTQLYAQMDVDLLLFPTAFLKLTGEKHWDVLVRSRALDAQCYVAGVSNSRDKKSDYLVYANSMVANPWGEVITKLGTDDQISCVEIDLDFREKVKRQLPVLQLKRNDIYKLKLSPSISKTIK
ncbi:nitrilase-related [Anaeramoeba flamelloides]|uniref:Nitrilase-related n=1 Tax=Anaeramoeba flamelloides TaxID=1746091 RepID=A0AAV7Z961_9EUKA|nr:nitrilase-related [Anaeramoeba flamelloides]